MTDINDMTSRLFLVRHLTFCVALYFFIIQVGLHKISNITLALVHIDLPPLILVSLQRHSELDCFVSETGHLWNILVVKADPFAYGLYFLKSLFVQLFCGAFLEAQLIMVASCIVSIVVHVFLLSLHCTVKAV